MTIRTPKHNVLWTMKNKHFRVIQRYRDCFVPLRSLIWNLRICHPVFSPDFVRSEQTNADRIVFSVRDYLRREMGWDGDGYLNFKISMSENWYNFRHNYIDYVLCKFRSQIHFQTPQTFSETGRSSKKCLDMFSLVLNSQMKFSILLIRTRACLQFKPGTVL